VMSPYLYQWWHSAVLWVELEALDAFVVGSMV
jgi:hypothetical protein